jgi:hypothetical protein
MNPWFRRARIDVDAPARSLAWRGDELVDWLAGGVVFRASGAVAPTSLAQIDDASFDAVITDASGRWAFVHARCGTKGALFHDGEFVRRIKRDSYHADAYAFPACLFARNGRMLIAHCPDSYARVEIEDALSGERLTSSDAREDIDFFHSRLAVSPNAKRLLSAGWVWHPWDVVQWLDLAPVLDDPTALDRWMSAASSAHVSLAEESSACFIGDEIIAIGSSSEPEDADEAKELDAETANTPRLRSPGLAIFDASTSSCIASIPLDKPPGAMMAAGFDHVVCFFEHPRLVSLANQDVVYEWSDLDSGDVVSSITWSRPHPVLALDAVRARFALQTSKGALEIVELDVADLPRTEVEAYERMRPR